MSYQTQEERYDYRKRLIEKYEINDQLEQRNSETRGSRNWRNSWMTIEPEESF